MCSNASVVVDVPAPEEPVTAIIGFLEDIYIKYLKNYALSLYVQTLGIASPDHFSIIHQTMVH